MNKDIFVKLLQQRQFKAVREYFGCNERSGHSLPALRNWMTASSLWLSALSPRIRQRKCFPIWRPPCRHTLVEIFSEKELKELLDDLYMDDTVDLLEELPANLVNRILDTVSASDRKLINQLLNYPDDSAGSIMTTEYVDIRETMTVAQAMAHIKETGIHKEDHLHMLCDEQKKTGRYCQRQGPDDVRR